MDVAGVLYLRVRDDCLYFADSGKRLMAGALEAVLSEVGQKDEGIVDNGSMVVGIRRVIGKLKKMAIELREQGSVEASVQEGVRAAFLAGYLPRSLAELDLDKVILAVIDRYRADSINFFPLVLRDVLSSIVSGELTGEIVSMVVCKVRKKLMQHLRKPCDERQQLPAVVLERAKSKRVDDMVASLVHDYGCWNCGRMLRPVSV